MERLAREQSKRAAQQKTEIKQKQKVQQERAEKGEPWLTAAIPMENPHCSCKLTHGVLQST